MLRVGVCSSLMKNFACYRYPVVCGQFLVGLADVSVCLAAITEYHMLSSLSNRNVSYSMEAGKSEMKVLVRYFSF